MMRFVETPTLINTNATPGMTAYSTLERSHAIHYRAQADDFVFFSVSLEQFLQSAQDLRNVGELAGARPLGDDPFPTII